MLKTTNHVPLILLLGVADHVSIAIAQFNANVYRDWTMTTARAAQTAILLPS